jgi:O-antigen/teichoic acid export membrane protein
MLSVLDMGFGLVITQRLATAFGAGDEERFVLDVGSSVGLVVAAFVLLIGLVFAVGPWIPGRINAPLNQTAALRSAILLTGIGAALQVIALGMWSVLQALQKVFWCEFSNLIAAILGLTATVIALFRGMGVVAFGVGVLVSSSSATALLTVVVAFEWHRRNLSLPVIRLRSCCELLKYSCPVIASRFVQSLVDNAQPVLVSACIGPIAAAILSLTGRIFTGCRTLLEPLSGSTFAGLAHLVGESTLNSGRVRVVLQELLTIIALSAALMLGMAAALNVSFGRLWVGPARFGGVALTIVICLATLAVFVNKTQGTILTALGDIRGPAWVSLLEVLIRVPLTIVLLLSLGIIGAPLAAIGSSFAIGSWYLFRSLRRRLSLSWTEALQVLGSGLPALTACISIAIAAALLLSPATSWFALSVRGALIGFLLMSLTLALTPFARNKLRQLTVSLLS